MSTDEILTIETSTNESPGENTESQDYDCTICRCPMKSKSFILNASENEDKLEEDTIRFKCGHAFHLSCACLSLRQSEKCPTCRDSNRSVFIYANDLNQDIQEDLEELVTGPLIQRGIRASELLSICGKKTEVQQARRKLNKALKEYTLYEHTIKRRRKKMLCETLSKFKDTYHNQFILNFNKVKKFARALQHVELKACKDIEPAEDLSHFVAYDPRDLLNGDLLRKNFWTY